MVRNSTDLRVVERTVRRFHQCAEPKPKETLAFAPVEEVGSMTALQLEADYQGCASPPQASPSDSLDLLHIQFEQARPRWHRY
jgi:hypothetical protein